MCGIPTNFNGVRKVSLILEEVERKRKKRSNFPNTLRELVTASGNSVARKAPQLPSPPPTPITLPLPQEELVSVEDE